MTPRRPLTPEPTPQPESDAVHTDPGPPPTETEPEPHAPLDRTKAQARLLRLHEKLDQAINGNHHDIAATIAQAIEALGARLRSQE